MKKALYLLGMTILICSTGNAQLSQADNVKKQLATENRDTLAWVHGGVLNVGINEGFLHNWPAGGEVASMTINSIFSGHLDRLDYKNIWSNNLDLNYGLLYAYSNSFVPRKTDDRIDFTSKYGIRIDTAKNFYFTGLFNFKSQFTKAFDYSVPGWDTTSTSRFFSPAYFTLAAGMEYRKGEDVSLFLSPIAGRAIYVDKYYTRMSQEGAFGVPYNKSSKYEFGAYFSGRYIIHIRKDMEFHTRLDAYANYLAKDTKDSTGVVVKHDNPGNVSFLFDNLFSWKISKYINLTAALTLVYDNEVPYSKTYTDANGVEQPKNEPGEGLGWLQMKQLFTFGVEYKF